MQRITIKNAGGSTYRVAIEKAGNFSIESLGMNVAFRGNIIDKLGRYEDLGLEPEELEKLIKDKCCRNN